MNEIIVSVIIVLLITIAIFVFISIHKDYKYRKKNKRGGIDYISRMIDQKNNELEEAYLNRDKDEIKAIQKCIKNLKAERKEIESISVWDHRFKYKNNY